MMTKLLRFFTFSILLLGLMTACSFPPTDKDEYFQQYDAFIAKVKENQTTISTEDWKKYDEQFKAFSVDYFQKFKADMSLGEKAKAKKLAAEYQVLKGKDALRDIFGGGAQEK